MSRGYYVTSTDTGIGKTVFSAGLAGALVEIQPVGAAQEARSGLWRR